MLPKLYWRVRFDDPRQGFGWLVREEGKDDKYFEDDGTPADDITGVTALDSMVSMPEPPEWADVG